MDGPIWFLWALSLEWKWQEHEANQSLEDAANHSKEYEANQSPEHAANHSTEYEANQSLEHAANH